MYASVFGNMLMCALLYLYIRRSHALAFRIDTAYFRHLVRDMVLYAVAIFLGAIFLKIDIFMLSILEPASQADVSISLYSIPLKIIDVGILLGLFFLSSLLPVLTDAYKQSDLSRLTRTISAGFRILFW